MAAVLAPFQWIKVKCASSLSFDATDTTDTTRFFGPRGSGGL
jgi:hypothetical protein